jgi:hypothetical protein
VHVTIEPEWWWANDTREWIFLPRALETVRQRILTYGANELDLAVTGLVRIVENSVAAGELWLGMRPIRSEQIIPIRTESMAANPLRRECLISGVFETHDGQKQFLFVRRLSLTIFQKNIKTITQRFLFSNEQDSSKDDGSPSFETETDFQAARRKWRKPTDKECEAALVTYLGEGHELTNTEADQRILETRIRKRLDRDHFRSLRRRYGSNIGPGPKRRNPRSNPRK